MSSVAEMKNGLYCVGELLGVDSKESNGKMYYKAKVLIGDMVKKFDVRLEEIVNVSKIEERARVMIGYFEFQGKFGTNTVLTSVRPI